MTQKIAKSFLLLTVILFGACSDPCETYLETSCACQYPSDTRQQESCQKQGEAWLSSSKKDKAQLQRCEKALSNCDCIKYNSEQYAECGLTRIGTDDTDTE